MVQLFRESDCVKTTTHPERLGAIDHSKVYNRILGCRFRGSLLITCHHEAKEHSVSWNLCHALVVMMGHSPFTFRQRKA